MKTATNPSSAPAADILRTHWPEETGKSLNLYLGTGRCGGCFDSYGLQHQGDLSPVARRVSRTWLAHGEVWPRGRHGLDTQPDFRYWSVRSTKFGLPMATEAYKHKAPASKVRVVKTQTLPKKENVTTLGGRNVFTAHQTMERW